MNANTQATKRYYLPYWRICTELVLAFVLAWASWQAWMLNYEAISWAMAGNYWPLSHGQELAWVSEIFSALALILALDAVLPRAALSASGIRLGSLMNIFRGRAVQSRLDWSAITEVKVARFLNMSFVKVTDVLHGSIYAPLCGAAMLRDIADQLRRHNNLAAAVTAGV